VAEPITLYAVHGSHPCVTAEAGLQLKRLSFKRVDLPYGLNPFMQLARFGKRTVPGLTVGAEKVVGSRLILRALEGLAPEPPLFPADPAKRAAVEEAERWGDEVLQEHVRWIAILALAGEPTAAPSYGSRSLPPIPEWAMEPATRALFSTEMRVLGHRPERVRGEYLPALPANLDHVDSLIADGVIGGKQVNAADLQIAPSVRLLLTMEDLREAIDARPCGPWARRIVPEYDGSLRRGVVTSPL
jgi:glutathione S-transferase